jgi:hypothetical protein
MVRGSTLPRTSGSDREQAAKITTDAVKTTAEITRNGTIKHFGAKPKERTDTKVVGILRIPNRRSRVAVTNGLCEYPPRDHGSLSQPPPAIPYFILSQGTNTRIHFDRIHFESSPFPSFDKGGAVDGLSTSPTEPSHSLPSKHQVPFRSNRIFFRVSLLRKIVLKASAS